MAIAIGLFLLSFSSKRKACSTLHWNRPFFYNKVPSHMISFYSLPRANFGSEYPNDTYPMPRYIVQNLVCDLSPYHTQHMFCPLLEIVLYTFIIISTGKLSIVFWQFAQRFWHFLATSLHLSKHNVIFPQRLLHINQTLILASSKSQGHILLRLDKSSVNQNITLRQQAFYCLILLVAYSEIYGGL